MTGNDARERLGEDETAPRIGDKAMATIAAEREAARAKTGALRAKRLAQTFEHQPPQQAEQS